MRINVILAILVSGILLALPVSPVFSAEGEKVDFPFYVYEDTSSGEQNFVPSGFMGDIEAVKMDMAYVGQYSGKNCLKFTYNAEVSSGSGWVGVYWQHPENNWGKIDAGYDLSDAKKLEFWAKGEKGGEKLEFKVGGLTGTYADSDLVSIGPLPLTKDWKKYEIDLREADMSYIIGGFVWAASRMDNPDGCVFYLDDIKFVDSFEDDDDYYHE